MLSPQQPSVTTETAVGFRTARACDLATIAGWVRSARECELWAGPRQAFPLDLDLLPADLEFHRSESLLMSRGQTPLGFGQWLQTRRGQCLFARLIVSPEQRRRGYGSLLLVELLRRARCAGYHTVGLNVDRDNLAAQGLYSRHGFRFTARPPGESASARSLYMSRQLTDMTADRGQAIR